MRAWKLNKESLKLAKAISEEIVYSKYANINSCPSMTTDRSSNH